MVFFSHRNTKVPPEMSKPETALSYEQEFQSFTDDKRFQVLELNSGFDNEVSAISKIKDEKEGLVKDLEQ